LAAQLVVVPAVQDVAQAFPLQPKLLGHAAVMGPEAQLPLPSHCVSVVSIPVEHETTFEHAVPAAAVWQAPVPDVQAPVCPQGGLAAHDAAQQTPFVPQTLLAHWSLPAQVPAPEPSFGWQVWDVVLQYAAPAHWLSAVQVVMHAPFAHA
jgi:hypothetical protein